MRCCCSGGTSVQVIYQNKAWPEVVSFEDSEWMKCEM